MIAHRKTSLTAGIFYLLTFVSVPTLALYGPVKSANFILGSGSNTGAVVSGILEIIVALMGIGTAVVLFKYLKKQSETLALGLIAARILEASSIFVGVAFLSTIVQMHRNGVGVDMVPVARGIVALHDRMFLLSQSFMPAIDDMLLGYMLLKSHLVPRKLAVIGIFGGPVLLMGYFAVLSGVLEKGSSLAGASSIFVALFELSLGIWLVVKGFNHDAVIALEKNPEL